MNIIPDEYSYPLQHYYGIEYRLEVPGIKSIGFLSSRSGNVYNQQQYNDFLMDNNIHKPKNELNATMNHILDSHEHLIDVTDDNPSNWNDKAWEKWLKPLKITQYKKIIITKPLPYCPDSTEKNFFYSYGIQQTPKSKNAPNKPEPPIKYKTLRTKNQNRAAWWS
eukprot:UN10069